MKLFAEMILILIAIILYYSSYAEMSKSERFSGLMMIWIFVNTLRI